MTDDFDPYVPFTYAEALRAGLPDRALRGAAYRKLFPNVYVARAVPDTLVVRSRAALRILPPDAVLSHATAARLWGGRAPDDPNIHVAFARDVRSTVDGIKVHRFRDTFVRRRRHGLPVTGPEQTMIHLARPLDLIDLVACADSLIRRKVTTPEDLLAAAQACRGHGGRLARQAALLARPRVDAPSETRVRLLMVLAGLPEPVVNHAVLREDGTEEYRLDLGYPRVKLGIEYDGRWHRRPEQQVADALRRQDLCSRGWRIEVLVAEDLYETPDATLARLYAVLAETGVQVPAVLSDEWRRYFPVRGLVA